MKNRIIKLFLIFIVGIVYSSTTAKKYYHFDLSYCLNDNEIAIRKLNRTTGKINEKKYIYSLEKKDKIDYIIFNNEKYLLLSCDDLFFLYNNQNNLEFQGTTFGSITDEFSCFFSEMMQSSYLQEGKNKYTAEKMNGYSIGNPWVEGAEGNGIGEWLSRYVSSNSNIYISIGFVDYNRPYLYSQNSRPKKIALYLDNEFIKYIELKDTPNFQKIEIPKDKKGVAKFVIEDVYKGSKFPNDTCINMFFYEPGNMD